MSQALFDIQSFAQKVYWLQINKGTSKWWHVHPGVIDLKEFLGTVSTALENYMYQRVRLILFGDNENMFCLPGRLKKSLNSDYVWNFSPKL